MKKILTYLICLAFALSLSGPVLAVDKKEKKPKTKTEEKKKPESSDKKKPEAKKKKYDDFIDKNKNGVDDRRENVKKKPASSKKDEK